MRVGIHLSRGAESGHRKTKKKNERKKMSVNAAQLKSALREELEESGLGNFIHKHVVLSFPAQKQVFSLL